MALLYRAELSPSKLELLAGWVPSRPWFEGSGELRLVASFRFDDPEGEVGIETLLVSAGDGPVLQVPVTYRGAALPGADAWLIGTMQHSVLGTRWTYDALGDSVYRDELARVIVAGETEAEQWIEIDGVMTQREPTARVKGSGGVAASDQLPRRSVEVVRVVAPGAGSVDPGAVPVLTGTWSGRSDPVVLALLPT